MKSSEVLNTAADLIERNGWWQSGGETDGSMPVCAANALVYAIPGTKTGPALLPPCRALWEHIGGVSLSDIWHWNDHPDRTAEEVIATLRAAALIEAAKERTDVYEVSAS